MKDKVLAVDIGTSSVRAMIVDCNGNILHKEQMKYDVITKNKYMQEQNPDELKKKRLCNHQGMRGPLGYIQG